MEKIKSAIDHQKQLIRFLMKYLPSQRSWWLKTAKEAITADEGMDAEQKARLYEDFRRDYDRHLVKYSEYKGYHFSELSRSEKKKYLPMRDLLIILEKFQILHPRQRVITDNKEQFLEAFKEYVHRKWMLVNDASSLEAVQAFLDETDVIVKPTDSCSGNGVYKIKRGEGDAGRILSGTLPVLIEECVHNEPGLAEFHSDSLNTVRVTTITNGKDVKFFDAVLRTGNHGSVFDNADAGGYFAAIDMESGKIISNGANEKGEYVEVHPFSGKRFMGYQVPRWEEVLSVCKEATLKMPDAYVLAWDIAITPTGIEIIESNSGPSIELHQIPLRKGVRSLLYSQLRELHINYLDVVCLKNIMFRAYLLLCRLRNTRRKDA